MGKAATHNKGAFHRLGVNPLAFPVADLERLDAHLLAEDREALVCKGNAGNMDLEVSPRRSFSREERKKPFDTTTPQKTPDTEAGEKNAQSECAPMPMTLSSTTPV